MKKLFIFKKFWAHGLSSWLTQRYFFFDFSKASHPALLSVPISVLCTSLLSKYCKIIIGLRNKIFWQKKKKKRKSCFLFVFLMCPVHSHVKIQNPFSIVKFGNFFPYNFLFLWDTKQSTTSFKFRFLMQPFLGSHHDHVIIFFSLVNRTIYFN